MNLSKIQFIGEPALDALAESAEFRIFGNTSRGLFVELASGKIVFISREPYRGPLTLNLSHPADEVSAVTAGEKGSIAGYLLSLPDSGISISWQAADIWQPPPPPGRKSAKRDQIVSALEFLDDPLLTMIAAKAEAHSLTDLEKRIAAVWERVKAADWEAAQDSASAILGLGTGLTPEGDDFLIGLSLAFVRTDAPRPQLEFVKRIAHMAQSRTTGLSANLLACAAEGLADERLIDACDALAANAPDKNAAIRALLGWGATSGRMALAGISAALLHG